MKIGKAILLGSKIRSKQKFIDFGKKRILDSLNITEQVLQQQTKAIFTAHGHYDHSMDVPFVHKYWLDQNANVYMNESAVNSCRNVIAKEKLHNIEENLSVWDDVGKSIDFASGDGSILKIYPILAAHNPHSRNIKLFSGIVMHPASYFNDPTDKTKVTDWLEGRTTSFLIDLVENGNIVYRIFLQSSSASFPDGMPPKSLLAGKKVDLAILGAASYHFSENTYPCKYLSELSPTDVMFIHWEDFFRSYKKKTKSLRKQDIARLLNEILPKCREKYILPVPGVVVSVGLPPTP